MNRMETKGAMTGLAGNWPGSFPAGRIDFVNGRVLTAEGVCAGASICFDNGRILSIDECLDQGDRVDLEGGWLVPGFIDTQVNGGGGVLFNDMPTLAAIETIGAAHARFGTTAFLPTLISASSEQILQAIDAVEEAISLGVPGCVGIHVEGPAISDRRRGIHTADRLRKLDEEVIDRLHNARAGRVMVTVAPERAGPETIRRLTEGGVIVSLGHSDCDYDTARAAIEAGARGATHLFNAMSPLLHRAPGLVGAILEDRTVWSGLIVDGEHLHPAALRIAIAARPADRLMLVTDAMPCVGSDITSFTLEGQHISVVDGRCIGEDGTLAGAALDMAQAVRNTVAQSGGAVADAVAMAAANPAAFLGLEEERGRIAPGLMADFVHMGPDLVPLASWIGGIRVS